MAQTEQWTRQHQRRHYRCQTGYHVQRESRQDQSLDQCPDISPIAGRRRFGWFHAGSVSKGDISTRARVPLCGTPRRRAF